MTLLVHPSTDIIIIMMLYIIASSTSWSRNIPYDKDNAMLFYTAMNDVIHNTSSCQMPPARLTHGSLWNRGPHEKWLLLKNYRKDKRKGDRSSPMICVCLFPYFVALKVFHWFLLHDNLLRHYTPQHVISYFLSLMAHTSKLTSLSYSLLVRDQNDIQVLGVCCSVSEEFGKNG